MTVKCDMAQCPYNANRNCERGLVVINTQGQCKAILNKYLMDEAREWPREKMEGVELKI